jgi:hypothetical protein
MDVGNSIRIAINDWEGGELESAMLHACNAVDGTAKKLYPSLQNKDRFTRILRENYAILGATGTPGIDPVATRYPVTVRKPTAPGGKPDLADVIYGIHRCTQGHGDELPEGFTLMEDAAGPTRITRMEIKPGAVRLSDRIIFGLITVAVLSPVNQDQSVPDGYHLTIGDSGPMMINDWWGRANDFLRIVAQDPTPLVTIDSANWTTR